MKLRRKKRKIPVVPVTSFGDIAFLLIIFFMIASVFMTEGHIKVKLARSSDIEKEKSVSVSLVLDKNGKLWLQGQQCHKEMVESYVKSLLENSEEKEVMLKIDRDQVQRDFGGILMALGDAGADIILLGEKEGK